MQRVMIPLAVLVLLAGCAGPEYGTVDEIHEQEPGTVSPEILKQGVWGGYMVDRDGMVRIIGTIEPLIAEEHIRFDYDFQFASEPNEESEAIHLYLDTRSTGIELGAWVGKKVAVVGPVEEEKVVGIDRQGGLDVRRKILGNVMVVNHIDVPPRTEE